MSVNLELVPVVMAMRESMGEENFHKWVQSMQMRVPTKFNNKNELVKCIEKAGYDAQNWGSAIKTHIKGEENFFFWEYAEGKWCAIFAKSDSRAMIKKFMDDLEHKSGTRVFSNTPQLKRKPQMKTFKYPTNFNDEDLLMKTLMDYGANPVKDVNGDIIMNLAGNEFKFHKIREEPYQVEVKSTGNSKQIYNHLSLIDGDYKGNVQAYTYENLKKNLEDRNLNIESEEVLEDNSIVITVNIQDN